MEKQTGTVEDKLKEIGAVKICEGAFHLQNSITDEWCFICHEPKNDNMALVRHGEREFRYICLDHPGAVAEFVRVYGKAPIGWTIDK